MIGKLKKPGLTTSTATTKSLSAEWREGQFYYSNGIRLFNSFRRRNRLRTFVCELFGLIIQSVPERSVFAHTLFCGLSPNVLCDLHEIEV